MMKKNITTLTLTLAMMLALGACDNKKFTVEGTVEGAQDSVLYLENVGLNGVQTLDSARLDAGGAFTFSAKATDAPEFYRLRIADQIINISIDSTETVGISAHYPNMASRYEVSGSDNCSKIRELSLMQIDLQSRLMAIDRTIGLSRQLKADSMQTLLDAYKEKVKREYIFKEPNKAYAYFALFQAIGPWLLFNPQSVSDDVKVFAAVATSWDTYYPGAERGQNLHNIAIEGMKNKRIVASAQQETIESSLIHESGVIDISLADNHGKVRNLTDLKGKVVLLDFHAFALDDSPQRILMLRDIYNKFSQQGLEIYQVSFDTDEHFWKHMTQQLPWICVRDADGMSSRLLALYNAPQVPEFYLVDRGGNLVKRSQQIADLEAEIRRLL